jgi:glycosyltransferase involved in cell wall biosynthesis
MEALQKPYMAVVRKSLRRAALRRTIGGVAYVFANSARTLELAQQSLGIDPKRAMICPPGVDEQFFQTREAGDPNILRLLTVTRLTKHSARKNVDGVLKAVAMLDGAPRVHYTIIGDGDDEERLQALAAELGIASQVDFKGRTNETDLLACYRTADLFVLAAKASKRDIEGFGIVYIEASATGVPSICSRAGGAVDALHEGENGLLIADSSPQSIAAGIRRFAASRDDYTAARARAVAEQYRWPGLARQLRDKINDELAKYSSNGSRGPGTG